VGRAGASRGPNGPLRLARGAATLRSMFGIFLLVGSLVPLAAMMIALFAAAWIRDGRRTDAPARR
jgi:hypothetical protein